MGKGAGQMIVGAVLVVAGIVTGGNPFLLSAGASLLAGGAASMLVKRPKLGIRSSDLGQNISDPVAALPVVYGKVRVGGSRIFMETTDDKRSLWLLIALSHGPVAGIDEVYVDGELATETDGRGKGDFLNYVTVWKAYGTDSQPGVAPAARGAISVTNSQRYDDNNRTLTLASAHSFLVGHVVRCSGVVQMTSSEGADYHLVTAVVSSTVIRVARYGGGTSASGGGGTVDFYSPDLPTLFGPRWTTSHRGRGVAFVAVRIRWNARFTTVPRIEAVVRGRTLVDPRATDTTRTLSAAAAGAVVTGAATSVDFTTATAHGYAEGDIVVLAGYTGPGLNGTHRVDRILSTTQFRVFGAVYVAGTGGTFTRLAYSTNPAVCIRDYLASPIYGAGAQAAELDDTAIAAEANYCDELLNAPLENSASFTNRRRITDIVVATGVATVTTTTAHQFTTGQTARISGMDTTTVLNATATITVTGASTFTFATAQANGTYTPPLQLRHRYEYTGESTTTNEAMGYVSVLKTQKRFEISGVVNTAQSVKENLEEMLSSCRGMLVYQSGKYRPSTRRPTTTHALALTEDIIVGDWEYHLPGQRDLANVIRAAFLDETKGYTIGFAEYPAPGMPNGFLTSDNNQLLRREIELPYTTDRTTAQQIAMVTRRESRNGIAVSVTCTEAALQYQVNDVVACTHPSPGWVAKLFWISQITVLPSALVRLTLSEYEATSYDLDAQDDTPFAPNTNLPVPPIGDSADPIPTPADFAVGYEIVPNRVGGEVDLVATYTRPTNIFFVQIDYEIRARPRGSALTFASQPMRLVIGSGNGRDRIAVAFESEYEITPVTYTTSRVGYRGTGSQVKTVTIPENPLADPTYATPVAYSDRIEYGFTYDTDTTEIEWWSTESAGDPGAVVSQQSIGTLIARTRKGDGRSLVAASLAGATRWRMTTAVAWNAVQQLGTVQTWKTQGATPTLPAAPTSATNQSNPNPATGSIINRVNLPGTAVAGWKIRTYRDGVAFGTDYTLVSGDITATFVDLTHSGLAPGGTSAWDYVTVNAGVESTKTRATPNPLTLNPGTIPTPTITAGPYSIGDGGFPVTVTPAANTPAGVDWHLEVKIDAGAYVEDTAATSQSTSLWHTRGMDGAAHTDTARVWGTKTGWTDSARSNAPTVSIPSGPV